MRSVVEWIGSRESKMNTEYVSRSHWELTYTNKWKISSKVYEISYFLKFSCVSLDPEKVMCRYILMLYAKIIFINYTHLKMELTIFINWLEGPWKSCYNTCFRNLLTAFHCFLSSIASIDKSIIGLHLCLWR